MKKLFFIFSLCLFYLSGHAQQPFCPTGATWYYYYVYPPFVQGYGYVKITYAGDITIGGHLCKQLEEVTYDYTNGTLNFVYTSPLYNIYQEGDTVFWYRNGVFLTLFNFRVQTGDQWTLDNSAYPGLTCDSFSVLKGINSGTMTVNSQ